MRKLISRLKTGRYTKPLLIWLLLYALMFVMLIAMATPEQYDIKTGYPAPVTIFATKDVEDVYVTEKLREEAAAAVDYSYGSIDSTVTGQVVSDFSTAYAGILELRNSNVTDIENMGDSKFSEIQASIGVDLTRSELTLLCQADADELDAVFTSAKDMIRETLVSTLPEGQESAALAKISRDLLTEGHSTALVNVVISIARETLRPNMLIDEETTEQNRQKARDMVETQMCVKGEVVVREGDIVTEGDYQLLDSLGLIKDSNFDIMLVLGIALIVALMISAMALYIHLYVRELYRVPRKLVLLVLIIVLVMALSMVFAQLNTYLMPVALGLMLISTLIDAKLALFVNVIMGFVTALFASSAQGVLSMASFSTLVMAIVSGPVLNIVVTRKLQRTSVLVAGVAVGVTNFATTVGIGLINSGSLATIFTNAAWAAAGAILSAVICIGLQPLLEWMFNLVTNAKLLELSNPNQPLLHRLLLEAPGTYHHSIIVANLADAAASAIGANALLARVAAYYHDIGKLKRPMYFKENQIGDNPHDRTDPRVSAAILTAHTRDGIQMAQKEHLPAEIIEIIGRHHGDSPVLFFYDKAKKQYGDDVDIADFRYEGPVPTRREGVVVMLADVVEAATRSMSNHDSQKVEQMVRKLINMKLTDGQLSHSQLTFSDLDKIANAFITVLTGVFHERIEYPDVKLPPRKSAEPQSDAQEAEQSAPETTEQPAENTAQAEEQSAEAAAEPAGDTQAAQE